MKTTANLLAFLIVLATAQASAHAKGTLDVEAAQALLDVQHLDGWLLHQSKGANAIAEVLVGPDGATRPWFYFIPANGSPMVLAHKADLNAFKDVVGTKLSYTGSGQIKSRLGKMLGDAKNIAMEFAPESGISSLTRVDARMAALVKGLGVNIASSAQLVQFTKAAWGLGGRISHYVAVHHLTKLVGEANQFIGVKLRAGELVTEFDVQTMILAGYKVRGLKGEPPLVAAGLSSADPNYRPSAANARVIKKGDVIQYELAAHIPTDARPIVANISWVAYAGAKVPAKVASAFAATVAARDATIKLIQSRVVQRREVAGFEAARAARESLKSKGLVDRFIHPTGHSLDTSVAGDGANLDDQTTVDKRTLVVGSGFTVGPGVYFPQDFGVRTEVGVFLAASGLEVTSPRQTKISTIAVDAK